MKKPIWLIATAVLFFAGLMVNLGCPAPGGTSGGSSSGCPPTNMPASPPACGPGTVDNMDGRGCVPYSSSSSSSSSSSRCPSNMELVDGRCQAKAL